MINLTVGVLETQNNNEFEERLYIIDKSSHNVRDNVQQINQLNWDNEDIISNHTNVINFKKALNNLSLTLRDFELFNPEFHQIITIQNISEFILTENHINHFNFLYECVNLFIQIVDYKINNYKKISNNASYKNKYMEFSRDFLKKEQYFYTKIYESDREYDKDFVDTMTKLLTR